ncbi:uncharacterized protein AC631_02321 [Debaryomyces fabryi]|uniref:Arrestin C-terminal-like domain-containing protein n=1 Tax=Debaryomyces fabryi TaxID=58627 RepID=A0A0V1Q0B0_9ASCO|nr:uncharacterized protein AC631_02321 [Debaryomyces fabryi]KSA01949.1 hypothetical protein AC631_02321 [Debaryomyces fabryi]CUM48487.1 unnamed protein product [Debaryomyces fabryi]
MSHRGFSFDKLKSKVTGRRSSESSIFELGKSKSGERRNSVSNPMIIIEESAHEKGRTGGVGVRNGRHGSQSMSVMSGIPTDRARSISTGRNVSKKQAKELIKQETALVILKKLLHVLLDLGLQQPIPLNTTNNSLSGPVSKSAKVYVANTHDCLYLSPASSASFTYEDVENGGIPQDHIDSEVLDFSAADINHEGDPEDEAPVTRNTLISLDSHGDEPPIEGMEPPERLRKKMESFNSPNYLCTKIDSESPIPHTFAVIIELKKETTIKDVNFEFQSVTNILWPTCDPYNKSFVKEKFKIGYMEWLAKMSDAFFYINTSNSNDVKTKEVTPEKLADITRNYKLISVRDLADGTDMYNNKNISRKSSVQFDRDELDDNQHAQSTSSSNGDVYKEGIYVFLLPILLPGHIPPSITTLNGSLAHILNVNINKVSAKLNRKVKVTALYNLPMVRTPPLHANSIADKPIYVDRVWNDSLHYIITFPKKYVSLGSEHSINVKLIPLVKDVVIKRIKFNISERITYVSKSLSKEYDYDGDDPFHVNAANNDKIRERLISVCELKTKNKSSNSNSEPYKEEFIKCPDNNLLFSCYEQQLSDEDIENLNLDDPLSKPPSSETRDLLIASPLAVNVALPFLTTRGDKTILTSSLNDDTYCCDNASNPTSRKASIAVNDPSSPPFTTPSSPIIGTLETNLTHNNDFNHNQNEALNDIITPNASAFMSEESHNYLKENIQQGYTTVSKALYPDSNFRHIQIHHRLQVCFRISKPDPKDNFKMHHYEVVVDTPLVLLSAKCNDDSIQLPKYDEIDLPRGHEQKTGESTKPSIPFRTPNYENNGVSIKPLNDDTELLPSFEEAISTPTSPITRSISLGEDQISRIPSIIPDEPAPAYEREMSASYEPHNVFNIDSIVDGANSPSTNLRRSAIRSSLVNSFAPSNSNNDLGNNDLGSDVLSTAKLETESNKGETLAMPGTAGSDDNISTTPTSSSNGTNFSGSSGISAPSEDSMMYANEMDNQTVPDTSGTETSQTDSSNPYKESQIENESRESNASYCGSLPLDAPPRLNMNQSTGIPPISPHYDKLNNVGISNDQVSVLTNFNFDQRLPLLENLSVDDVNSNAQSSTKHSDEVENHTTGYHDKQKRSTENLAMIMEMNKAQDIYRAV